MKKWNYIRYVFTGSPFFFFIRSFVFYFFLTFLLLCLRCFCRPTARWRQWLWIVRGTPLLLCVSHTCMQRTYWRRIIPYTWLTQHKMPKEKYHNKRARAEGKNSFACMVRRRVHNNKINSSRRSCIYIYYDSRDCCHLTSQFSLSPSLFRAIRSIRSESSQRCISHASSFVEVCAVTFWLLPNILYSARADRSMHANLKII